MRPRQAHPGRMPMPPSDARLVQVPMALLHLRPQLNRVHREDGNGPGASGPVPSTPPSNEPRPRLSALGPDPPHKAHRAAAPKSGRLPRTPAHTEATPSTAGTQQPAQGRMADIPDRLGTCVHSHQRPNQPFFCSTQAMMMRAPWTGTKPNAPRPVRGRSEQHVWGLPSNTAEEQTDMDNDSMLVLRQMYLTSLAYQGLSQCHPPVGYSFLEHPRDPMEVSASPQAQGRMAALLLRILYYLFPQIDWGFVFVDDFCWLLRLPTGPQFTAALLGTLVALGTPLSWKKTHLAEINTWLGFVIHPTIPRVQMAAPKRIKVMELLEELANGSPMSAKAIEKAMGRIQWATACCPLTKSMLQPLCLEDGGQDHGPPRWSVCWPLC